MSLHIFDTQFHSLIDSSRLDDFLQHSEHMMLMKNNLDEWFAHEEKMKECRSSNYNQISYEIQEIMKTKKEKDYQQTQEESQTLKKLNSEIKKIERMNAQNDQDQLLAEKQQEKDRLEHLYHQNKLDRLKDILLFHKESRFYLAAINNLKKYYQYMTKLKESIEESYETYLESDYDALMNEIEHPLECFICPRCSAEIYEEPDNPDYFYDINSIFCTTCFLEFCSKCDKPIEEHYMESNYPICFGIDHCKQYNSPSKHNLFYIWPMDYENRKQYSIWKKIYDQYTVNDEKFNKLHFDFMIQKDEKPKDGSKVISLSKLCIRTRIARVLLRETTDRNKVKDETMKIVNTVLTAQSIITSAYPTLFYMIDDQEKTDSLNEALHSLEEATNAFIEILYHPEHSSTIEMNQNVESLQKLMNDISILYGQIKT